jgi:glycosyltransferase involved in cell wall biosynthesis
MKRALNSVHLNSILAKDEFDSDFLDLELSIIVPVYNCEQFIGECLESIVSQLNDRVEVIVVDDGSTDDSGSIIQSFAATQLIDGSFRLFHQKNAGPGGARNFGISHAKGRFIGFLDSDDVLDPDYVATVLGIIKGGGPDIVQFRFKRFSDIRYLMERPLEGGCGLAGLHAVNDICEQVFARTAWFPSTRIYRRSLFDGVRFPERVHYEDVMTIPFVFLKAASVFFTDAALLAYRFNPRSITSVHTPEQLYGLRDFFDSIPPDQIDALKILKIRVGRSVAIFSIELLPMKLFFHSTIGILVRSINQVVLPRNAVKHLLLADRLFYESPLLYFCVDRFRLPLKCTLSKIRVWFTK